MSAIPENLWTANGQWQHPTDSHEVENWKRTEYGMPWSWLVIDRGISSFSYYAGADWRFLIVYLFFGLSPIILITAWHYHKPAIEISLDGQKLDVNEPYQAHAFFILGFYCTDCGAMLDVQPPFESATDEWCIGAARQAGDSGWYVPPSGSESRMDFETCFCPLCAAKHGVQVPKPSSNK